MFLLCEKESINNKAKILVLDQIEGISTKIDDSKINLNIRTYICTKINLDTMQVYRLVNTYTLISLVCSQKEHISNDIPVAVSILASRS